MTSHALIQYIKYAWSAKKLHGVHSPFAYSFSENLLYSASANSQPLQETDGLIYGKYAALTAAIKNYYGYNTPLLLSATTDVITTEDFIIMSDNNPGKWIQTFNKFTSSFDSNSVIIIPSIHTTKRHTAKWKRLYTHPKILMSIDLYGLGIIFFRKEFREKQHFILKY